MLRHDREQAQFFICGPEQFMMKTEMVIGFMKFTRSNIHREVFTIKNTQRPAPELFPNCEVRLETQQESYHFEVEAGKTILEAALDAGVDIPYSCRAGTCTTCSGDCLEGNAKMYTQNGIMDTVSTKGLLLTCVGYPITEKLVLRIR